MGSVRQNVTWLLLQRVIELLVRFVVVAWLARYLGPLQFGVYAYAASFVALFLDASILGLDQIVVRELTRAPTRAGEVLATAVGIRLVAAVTCFVLACVIALTTELERQSALLIVVLAGQILFNPALVLEAWFQSRVRVKFSVWTRTVVTLAIAALQAAFILTGQSLEAFIWLMVLQAILTAVGAVCAFVAFGPGRLQWRFSGGMARAMLADAWPLLISGISVSVYMRIDQVMLARMAGVAEVGIYGAAVKLSELWYALPIALAVSVFPSIVSLRAAGQSDAYLGKIRTVCDAMVLYSYLVIIGVWLLAPALVRVLYGPLYEQSASVLKVHVVALLFVALGVVYTRWLTVEERTALVLLSTAVGAVCNVALNLVFIPGFGALGAAWATVFSYAAATFAVPLCWPGLLPVRDVMARSLSAPLRIGPLLSEFVSSTRRRVAQ